MGWHADDEDMFQGWYQPIRIISMSLGAARTFQVKGKWRGATTSSVNAMSGDLICLDGWLQRYYVHRVPKETQAKGRARINLTWRWIRKHQQACPANALKADERRPGRAQDDEPY